MVPPEQLCMGCMEPRTGSACARCGWVEGTPASSPVFLQPRTVLDERYLLGRVLGAGGFGITYLAWDLNLDLKLAVKEYFPNAFGVRGRNNSTVSAANTQARGAFEHGLAKFQDEGRALARFQGHPSIASVMTFFRQNGTSYLVMKYEDGITLKQYLEDHGGRIGFEKTMKLAMPVMDALRAVHQENILHRDISPDNIIINRSGQVKILDFGSAKRDMTSQDRTLQITLKPGFSPEEQYRAKGKQGPWTDVYAVGATLYQCLAGAKPPDALERLHTDTLQPPSQLGVEIPKKCEKALLKSLAIRAADRFQTMEDFQKEFAFDSPAPSPLERSRQWLRPYFAKLRDRFSRRKGVLAAVGGAVAVLFILIRVLPGLFLVPQILQFTTDPSIVPPGQSATLHWSVAGGKVGIAPGIGQVQRNSGDRQVTPLVTTTYTLTASGPLRSVSKIAKVTVATQPLAVSFTADPTIKSGAATELSWSVGGSPTAITIDQGIGPVKSSDRLKVSPTANTTYTLKAEGPNGAVGQASVTVLIEMSVPPPVVVLKSDPATIRRGEKAQLTWQVTGGDNTLASLDQNIGRVKLQDTLSVSPQQTTRYKLLARNPGGTASKYVTVEVLQPDPPKIAKFRVEPESIHFGQNATLLWSVSGETESVSITPGIGSVPAEGSRGVSPRIPTTYAISVTGPGGTSTAEATLQVLTRTLAIRSFTATPQTVLPGHGVILHWSIDGDVDNVTLDPGAVRLKPEGAKLVTPMVGTRYTLTASGPGGTKSEFVDVQVSNEPIAIAYFQVRPLPLPVKEPKNLAVVKIKRGESAVISWKVTGSVTDLSIEPAVPNPQGRKTGTATVTPDRDTVYTLTAKAANRPPVSAIVKVEVKK